MNLCSSRKPILAPKKKHWPGITPEVAIGTERGVPTWKSGSSMILSMKVLHNGLTWIDHKNHLGMVMNPLWIVTFPKGFDQCFGYLWMFWNIESNFWFVTNPWFDFPLSCRPTLTLVSFLDLRREWSFDVPLSISMIFHPREQRRKRTCWLFLGHHQLWALSSWCSWSSQDLSHEMLHRFARQSNSRPQARWQWFHPAEESAPSCIVLLRAWPRCSCPDEGLSIFHPEGWFRDVSGILPSLTSTGSMDMARSPTVLGPSTKGFESHQGDRNRTQRPCFPFWTWWSMASMTMTPHFAQTSNGWWFIFQKFLITIGSPFFGHWIFIS